MVMSSVKGSVMSDAPVLSFERNGFSNMVTDFKVGIAPARDDSAILFVDELSRFPIESDSLADAFNGYFTSNRRSSRYEGQFHFVNLD